MIVGCFLLTWLIYRNGHVEWYSGVTFEEAKEAGEARRKEYAFQNMKRFRKWTILFFLYMGVSFLLHFPDLLDILAAVICVVMASVSTFSLHL